MGMPAGITEGCVHARDACPTEVSSPLASADVLYTPEYTDQKAWTKLECNSCAGMGATPAYLATLRTAVRKATSEDPGCG